MIRIHYIKHVPFEGLGSIEAWIRNSGNHLSLTRLYAGETLPDIESFDWLFVMGGPMNIYETNRFSWLVEEKRFIERAVNKEKVVLGICLGAQLLADILGKKVFPGPEKEIGWFSVYKTPEAIDSPSAQFMPIEIEAFHWHGDTFDLPSGAIHLAQSTACESQGFSYDGHVIGLQFHLETTRSSVEALIRNCGQEIVQGPYIQTPEIMLKEGGRFREINKIMAGLLDQLSGDY